MRPQVAQALESRVLLSTFYVSTSGNDANVGTISAPFATIARGMQAAQPGDSVLLRGGTYRETISAVRGGLPDAPITLKSYNNEPVYISASDVVSGPWTQTSPGSGIYWAPISTSLPTTFWTSSPVQASGAGIAERGSDLLATVVNDSAYSTVLTRSINASSAWNFFSQAITWRVRGLSISSTGTTAITPSQAYAWFSIMSNDWSGWSANDSINVQFTGAGALALTLKKNAVNSWGTWVGYVTNTAITGFDLTLSPGSPGNLAYTLTAYPTGQVVATGQWAISQAEWSDGGTGSTSVLDIFAQEGVTANDPTQQFQLKVDSYQIIAGASSVLLDDFNDGDPTSANYFPAGRGSTLSSGYDQIFVNGVMQTEARHANKVTADLLNPDTFDLTMSNNYVLSSPALAGKPDNYYAGARFLGRVGQGWAWQTAVVASSTGNTLTLDPATVSSWWWPNMANEASNAGIGYLYGKLSFLDADGEWYRQRNASGPDTLYLRTTGGANPTGQLVEHKVRNWTININGYDNIILSGLNLRGGAVQLNGSGLVLENSDAQYLSHFLTFTSGSAGDGGTPQGSGILVGGTGNTVRGCTIHDTAGSGIVSTGSNHLFTRNLIYDVDYSGTYATGMAINSSDSIVTFNTIHDAGRDILRLGAGGLAVMYNDLYHAGRMALDLGAIYTWGTNGTDAHGHKTRIAYNWLHDRGNPNDPLSAGLYLDNFARNYILDHNVVWGFPETGFNSSGIKLNAPMLGVEIYNNTIVGAPSYNASTYSSFPGTNPDPSFWTTANHGEDYIAQNNLVIAYGTDPATIFENYAGQDFRPRTGTAAVDPATSTGLVQWVTTDGTTNVPSTFALWEDMRNQRFAYREVTGQGVVIPGINDFYLGTTPDSGAYERGMTYWTVGVNGVVDTTPPTVSATINSGAAQRSMVKRLDVLFSEPVSLSANAVQVLLSTGAAPANTVLSVTNPSGDHKSYVLTFSGTGIIGDSLPDGVYDLVISAAGVPDLAGNIMAADHTQRFHRLFGDADGNKVVNASDYTALRNTFDKHSSDPGFNDAFDYENNVVINASDLTQFRRRFSLRYVY